MHWSCVHNDDIDGLKQNCGNSIANALELPQICIKPSIWVITKIQCIHNLLYQCHHVKCIYESDTSDGR